MINVNLGKVTGGYDAVRAHLFELAYAAWDGSPSTSLVASATGSASLSLWAQRGLLTRSAAKAPGNQRVLTRRTR